MGGCREDTGKKKTIKMAERWVRSDFGLERRFQEVLFSITLAELQLRDRDFFKDAKSKRDRDRITRKKPHSFYRRVGELEEQGEFTPRLERVEIAREIAAQGELGLRDLVERHKKFLSEGLQKGGEGNG